MRNVVILSLFATVLHAGAWAQTASRLPPIKACSLLTRDLVDKLSVANPKSVASKPNEVSLGSAGIACEWGDVLLPVDPATPAQIDKLYKPGDKDWEIIRGVGDAAYLHNVKDVAAELQVRVGARTFSMILTIPVGSTTAAAKPNLIAAADTIVSKLR